METQQITYIGIRRRWRDRVATVILIISATLIGAASVAAQDSIIPQPDENRDQSRIVGARPDWAWLEQIRFVTTSDFPPFNYYDEDGVLTGLNVDLARDICRVLSVNCQVSELEWGDLAGTIKEEAADAAVAAIAITPESLEKFDFSDIYLQIPARFTAPRGSDIDTVSRATIAGKTVGVARQTAHHAYLKTFFPETELKLFDSVDDARAALRAGSVDLVFADGLSTVFWVNGAASRGCCRLAGGGFLETKYFGQGLAIAVKNDNDRLVRVLNYALLRLRASGRLEELMLRYFPLSLY